MHYFYLTCIIIYLILHNKVLLFVLLLASGFYSFLLFCLSNNFLMLCLQYTYITWMISSFTDISRICIRRVGIWGVVKMNMKNIAFYFTFSVRFLNCFLLKLMCKHFSPESMCEFWTS